MDEETLAAYYERLPVGDDYFANVQAYAQAERARDLAKIGQPVDRSEWGMTASTVNAYYSPSMCVLCLNLAAAVRSIARAFVTVGGVPAGTRSSSPRPFCSRPSSIRSTSAPSTS